MISRDLSTQIKQMNIGIGRFQRAYHKCLALLFGDRVFYEHAWRRVFGVPPPVYQPHPYLLYELNPDWRSRCGKSRHNPDGFRGRPIQAEKSGGKVRIVCMGESSTYCTGIIKDEDTYPARLEHHLQLAGISVEIINAGVGGYTSLENLMRYHFKIRCLQPDLVVYYFTHNDVHPRRFPALSLDYREYSQSWFEPHNAGLGLGWLGRRIALSKGDIGKIVRRYSEYSGRRHAANVEANPPLAFRQNILALARMAHADGVQVLIALPNYHSAEEAAQGWQEVKNPAWRAVWEHRTLVVKMAKAEGFNWFDFSSRIPYPKNDKEFPSEFYLDGVHFNESGADLAGRMLAEELLKQEWGDIINQGMK